MGGDANPIRNQVTVDDDPTTTYSTTRIIGAGVVILVGLYLYSNITGNEIGDKPTMQLLLPAF